MLAAGRMGTKQVEDPQTGVQNVTDPSVVVEVVAVVHTSSDLVAVASYAVAVVAGANIGCSQRFLVDYYEVAAEEDCLVHLP